MALFTLILLQGKAVARRMLRGRGRCGALFFSCWG